MLNLIKYYKYLYKTYKNIYMDGVMKDVKMGMGRREVSFLEDGESGDFLASCIQMTWFYMVSWKT